MQSKLLLYLCLYLLVGIFLSNPIISQQRSKVWDYTDNQILKEITDTLETMDNFQIFDSLLARTDTIKYFHLYCMGKDYAQVKPSLSKTIADSILEHSQKDKYIRGVISAYNLRGIIYTYEDNYVDAVTNLKEAIKIGETYKDNSTVYIKDKYGCTLYYLGDLYFKRNDYKVALDYYKRSLDVFTSYSQFDLYVEDVSYLLNGVAFTTIREDKAYAMYSLGKTYLKMKNLDLARKYLSNSLQIAKETKFYRLVAMAYYSFSELHFALNDTTIAKEYLDKSTNLSIANHLNEYTIYNYLTLMKIDLAQRNYTQINSLYSKLITLTTIMNMRSEKVKHTNFIRSIYMLLANQQTHTKS